MMKRVVPVLALVAAWTSAGFAQPLAMHDAGGVRYACGGAGAEERAELAQLRPQASAELLFVHGRRGGYAAGVGLLISDAKGAALLRVEAPGPMCVLALPAGDYRIEARIGEAVRVQRIRIATGTGKPARAVLVFPALEWDGVRASDEEKAQGRR